MSEIITQGVEYLPYIGAAAGAIAGMGIETVAVRQIGIDEKALASELNDIGIAETSRGSLVSRFARTGRATLVVAGISVGMLNGLAWQTEATQETAPYLGVVVDHSGAVQGKALEGVNTMATMFDSEDFNATAYVAAYSEVNPMEPSMVAETEPFGDAPLDQAYTLALAEALKIKSETGNIGENKSGIFIITNGNEPGSADAVIAAADAQEIPFFVANVEGDSNPVIVEQLKKVAKETGGKYWDVDADKTDKMVDTIQGTLEDNNLKQDQPNRWPLKIAAGIAGVGLFITGFKNRRREPTYKKVSN